MGALLVTLAGGMASFGWALALGFAMSMASLGSLAILAALPRDALTLRAEQTRARTFKGGEVATKLTVGTRQGTDVAQVTLSAAPDGLSAEVEGEGRERVLRVKSAFAGVFRGLKIRVWVSDPLKLFSRSKVHELAFAFEFLPTYLLEKRAPLVVSAAMLGDYPAGRKGLGQEFYSAAAYTPSSPSKDILWKRQAKLPNDGLLVRTGEANIPETLTVCFLEKATGEERNTPRWMDLASEAVARIGLPAVATGTTLRLVHVVGSETTVSEARDAGSLAELLIGLWSGWERRGGAPVEPEDSDIIIAAQTELEDKEVLGLVLSKPSVVLTWGPRPEAMGSRVVFFTGGEDVSALVARVLSR